MPELVTKLVESAVRQFDARATEGLGRSRSFLIRAAIDLLIDGRGGTGSDDSAAKAADVTLRKMARGRDL